MGYRYFLYFFVNMRINAFSMASVLWGCDSQVRAPPRCFICMAGVTWGRPCPACPRIRRPWAGRRPHPGGAAAHNCAYSQPEDTFNVFQHQPCTVAHSSTVDQNGHTRTLKTKLNNPVLLRSRPPFEGSDFGALRHQPIKRAAPTLKYQYWL